METIRPDSSVTRSLPLRASHPAPLPPLRGVLNVLAPCDVMARVQAIRWRANELPLAPLPLSHAGPRLPLTAGPPDHAPPTHPCMRGGVGTFFGVAGHRARCLPMPAAPLGPPFARRQPVRSPA